MRLEIGTFPVKDILLGSKTVWHGGVLEVDEHKILELATADPMVAWADVQVTKPGDSTRIVRILDVIEPKTKVQGEGTVYPGIAGRPVDTVGQGRTHRFGGMTLVMCGEMPPVNVDGSKWWGRSDINFIDMSGPGAVTPFASTINLCVSMLPHESAYADDWNRFIQQTMLNINDLLGSAILDLGPPEQETYDLDSCGKGLPNLVFVPILASAEHRFGSRTSLGTGIYGIGRLTQPWLIEPTEVIDGAICGSYQENFTWPVMETIVPHMCSRHGHEFNFVGCIVVRSNWESQAEKQLIANRAAQLAASVKADGAIVTTNVRGQRFLETVLTVQALEKLGINTVLMTEEEDNEGGSAPPLLISSPEVISVVSAGTGGVDAAFSPVKRVVGLRHPESHWFEEKPPIHGRYGVSHLHDYYGFGKQGCLDF